MAVAGAPRSSDMLLRRGSVRSIEPNH